jgi:hypothetical protein
MLRPCGDTALSLGVQPAARTSLYSPFSCHSECWVVTQRRFFLPIHFLIVLLFSCLVALYFLRTFGVVFMMNFILIVF